MSEEIAKTETIIPKPHCIEGVIRLEEGMTLIHNLDQFLSLKEEKALGKAMEGQRAEVRYRGGKKRERKQ